MALSGSQITRVGGHGAGRAYSGFLDKAIQAFKFLPRVIAIIKRKSGIYLLNRGVEVGIMNRSEEVGISSTERNIGIQKGKGE
jgi:hypothetical protein